MANNLIGEIDFGITANVIVNKAQVNLSALKALSLINEEVRKGINTQIANPNATFNIAAQFEGLDARFGKLANQRVVNIIEAFNEAGSSFSKGVYGSAAIQQTVKGLGNALERVLKNQIKFATGSADQIVKELESLDYTKVNAGELKAFTSVNLKSTLAGLQNIATKYEVANATLIESLGKDIKFVSETIGASADTISKYADAINARTTIDTVKNERINADPDIKKNEVASKKVRDALIKDNDKYKKINDVIVADTEVLNIIYSTFGISEATASADLQKIFQDKKAEISKVKAAITRAKKPTVKPRKNPVDINALTDSLTVLETELSQIDNVINNFGVVKPRLDSNTGIVAPIAAKIAKGNAKLKKLVDAIDDRRLLIQTELELASGIDNRVIDQVTSLIASKFKKEKPSDSADGGVNKAAEKLVAGIDADRAKIESALNKIVSDSGIISKNTAQVTFLNTQITDFTKFTDILHTKVYQSINDDLKGFNGALSAGLNKILSDKTGAGKLTAIDSVIAEISAVLPKLQESGIGSLKSYADRLIGFQQYLNEVKTTPDTLSQLPARSRAITAIFNQLGSDANTYGNQARSDLESALKSPFARPSKAFNSSKNSAQILVQHQEDQLVSANEALLNNLSSTSNVDDIRDAAKKLINTQKSGFRGLASRLEEAAFIFESITSESSLAEITKARGQLARQSRINIGSLGVNGDNSSKLSQALGASTNGLDSVLSSYQTGSRDKVIKGLDSLFNFIDARVAKTVSDPSYGAESALKDIGTRMQRIALTFASVDAETAAKLQVAGVKATTFTGATQPQQVNELKRVIESIARSSGLSNKETQALLGGTTRAEIGLQGLETSQQKAFSDKRTATQIADAIAAKKLAKDREDIIYNILKVEQDIAKLHANPQDPAAQDVIKRINKDLRANNSDHIPLNEQSFQKYIENKTSAAITGNRKQSQEDELSNLSKSLGLSTSLEDIEKVAQSGIYNINKRIKNFAFQAFEQTFSNLSTVIVFQLSKMLSAAYQQAAQIEGVVREVSAVTVTDTGVIQRTAEVTESQGKLRAQIAGAAVLFTNGAQSAQSYIRGLHDLGDTTDSITNSLDTMSRIALKAGRDLGDITKLALPIDQQFGINNQNVSGNLLGKAVENNVSPDKVQANFLKLIGNKDLRASFSTKELEDYSIAAVKSGREVDATLLSVVNTIEELNKVQLKPFNLGDLKGGINVGVEALKLLTTQFNTFLKNIQASGISTVFTGIGFAIQAALSPIEAFFGVLAAINNSPFKPLLDALGFIVGAGAGIKLLAVGLEAASVATTAFAARFAALGVSLRLSTTATAGLVGGLGLVSKALSGLLVFLKSPIGLVITGVAAAYEAFRAFKDNQVKVNAELENTRQALLTINTDLDKVAKARSIQLGYKVDPKDTKFLADLAAGNLEYTARLSTGKSGKDIAQSALENESFGNPAQKAAIESIVRDLNNARETSTIIKTNFDAIVTSFGSAGGPFSQMAGNFAAAALSAKAMQDSINNLNITSPQAIAQLQSTVDQYQLAAQSANVTGNIAKDQSYNSDKIYQLNVSKQENNLSLNTQEQLRAREVNIQAQLTTRKTALAAQYAQNVNPSIADRLAFKEADDAIFKEQRDSVHKQIGFIEEINRLRIVQTRTELQLQAENNANIQSQINTYEATKGKIATLTGRLTASSLKGVGIEGAEATPFINKSSEAVISQFDTQIASLKKTLSINRVTKQATLDVPPELTRNPDILNYLPKKGTIAGTIDGEGIVKSTLAIFENYANANQVLLQSPEAQQIDKIVQSLTVSLGNPDGVQFGPGRFQDIKHIEAAILSYKTLVDVIRTTDQIISDTKYAGLGSGNEYDRAKAQIKILGTGISGIKDATSALLAQKDLLTPEDFSAQASGLEGATGKIVALIRNNIQTLTDQLASMSANVTVNIQNTRDELRLTRLKAAASAGITDPGQAKLAERIAEIRFQEEKDRRTAGLIQSQIDAYRNFADEIKNSIVDWKFSIDENTAALKEKPVVLPIVQPPQPAEFSASAAVRATTGLDLLPDLKPGLPKAPVPETPVSLINNPNLFGIGGLLKTPSTLIDTPPIAPDEFKPLGSSDLNNFKDTIEKFGGYSQKLARSLDKFNGKVNIDFSNLNFNNEAGKAKFDLSFNDTGFKTSAADLKGSLDKLFNLFDTSGNASKNIVNNTTAINANTTATDKLTTAIDKGLNVTITPPDGKTGFGPIADPTGGPAADVVTVTKGTPLPSTKPITITTSNPTTEPPKTTPSLSEADKAKIADAAKTGTSAGAKEGVKAGIEEKLPELVGAGTGKPSAGSGGGTPVKPTTATTSGNVDPLTELLEARRILLADLGKLSAEFSSTYRSLDLGIGPVRAILKTETIALKAAVARLESIDPKDLAALTTEIDATTSAANRAKSAGQAALDNAKAALRIQIAENFLKRTGIKIDPVKLGNVNDARLTQLSDISTSKALNINEIQAGFINDVTLNGSDKVLKGSIASITPAAPVPASTPIPQAKPVTPPTTTNIYTPEEQKVADGLLANPKTKIFAKPSIVKQLVSLKGNKLAISQFLNKVITTDNVIKAAGITGDVLLAVQAYVEVSDQVSYDKGLLKAVDDASTGKTASFPEFQQTTGRLSVLSQATGALRHNDITTVNSQISEKTKGKVPFYFNFDRSINPNPSVAPKDLATSLTINVVPGTNISYKTIDEANKGAVQIFGTVNGTSEQIINHYVNPDLKIGGITAQVYFDRISHGDTNAIFNVTPQGIKYLSKHKSFSVEITSEFVPENKGNTVTPIIGGQKKLTKITGFTISSGFSVADTSNLNGVLTAGTQAPNLNTSQNTFQNPDGTPYNSGFGVASIGEGGATLSDGFTQVKRTLIKANKGLPIVGNKGTTAPVTVAADGGTTGDDPGVSVQASTDYFHFSLKPTFGAAISDSVKKLLVNESTFTASNVVAPDQSKQAGAAYSNPGADQRSEQTANDIYTATYTAYLEKAKDINDTFLNAIRAIKEALGAAVTSLLNTPKVFFDRIKEQNAQLLQLSYQGSDINAKRASLQGSIGDIQARQAKARTVAEYDTYTQQLAGVQSQLRDINVQYAVWQQSMAQVKAKGADFGKFFADTFEQLGNTISGIVTKYFGDILVNSIFGSDLNPKSLGGANNPFKSVDAANAFRTNTANDSSALANISGPGGKILTDAYSAAYPNGALPAPEFGVGNAINKNNPTTAILTNMDKNLTAQTEQGTKLEATTSNGFAQALGAALTTIAINLAIQAAINIFRSAMTIRQTDSRTFTAPLGFDTTVGTSNPDKPVRMNLNVQVSGATANEVSKLTAKGVDDGMNRLRFGV